MAKYSAPEGPGDIIMIQSEYTGAVDILSAELETTDLLSEQKKGKNYAFTTMFSYGSVASVLLKKSARFELFCSKVQYVLKCSYIGKQQQRF